MSTRLCSLAEIGELGKEVAIPSAQGQQYLMLFQRGGQVLAFHNVCPHQGRALNWTPDRFLFSPEGCLICPHHGASFELPSGTCVAGPCVGASLQPVAVDVKDDAVWLSGKSEADT